jgi:S1-C subfamily serine protease
MFAVPLLLTMLAPQDGADAAAVRAAQAARAAVVARVAPAVCSVMPLDAQGGGSGVIIDPLGFVLTNFHVVQRRQGRPGPGPEPEPELGTGEVRRQLEPLFPHLPWERFEEIKRAVHAADVPAWFRDRDEYERFKGKLDELRGWLPQPRYAAPAPDDDGDDPAWRVMKIGLPDGELYLADTLGIDPGSDLAILLLRPRPDGAPYPAVRLGDSDQLLVGESVFAMGNPFLLATDFTPTVTWGIVSGTHRYQSGGGNRFLVYPDCVQVDAPVNPGNSGGPLFNERGEVVGINGRISVRDRGRVNTGVGFAIASNQIRNFLGDLMAGRHAEHGTLDLNAWFMNAPGEQRRGVFVQSLFRDSKVAALGVGLGDELVAFNGEPVRAANQLATRVGVLPEGSWVSLTFKPRAGENGFGAERTVHLALPRLDTGSSRDEDRIATPQQRRLARAALTRTVGDGEAASEGATIECTAGDGSRRRIARLGERLRIDAGERSLVRTAPGEGFALRDGAAAALSAEEQALLERVWRSDPLLWRGAQRRERVEASLLAGGSLVFGDPAFRFALPGDGECEVLLYEGGAPAGCRYRDPLRKQLVELRYAREGGTEMQVIADGALETGWTVAVDFAPPDEALFRRPQ